MTCLSVSLIVKWLFISLIAIPLAYEFLVRLAILVRNISFRIYPEGVDVTGLVVFFTVLSILGLSLIWCLV